MSESVHLDGLNVVYSIRWGKGMTEAPPEWDRLKSAVEYFQGYDVEIHIHAPAWARKRIKRLYEAELNGLVVFHWIDIPGFRQGTGRQGFACMGPPHQWIHRE